jgi:AcrR family transcriptional regulator
VQRAYNEIVPAERPPTKRAEQRRQTEARILAAARRAFASSGYDRATIRAIAEAAEVNPGLVMHYFGSKQELFNQAASLSGASETESPEQLVEFLLGSLGVKLEGLPVTSTATLRSMLTHPDAAHDVRLAASRQTEQIAGGIDADNPDLRATLIGTIILGVVIGRHLLSLDILRDAEPEQVIDLLRPVFGILAHDQGKNPPTNGRRRKKSRPAAERLVDPAPDTPEAGS